MHSKLASRNSKPGWRGSAFADFLVSLRARCEEIDRGRPRPFYLVHGGQEYFVEWAATNLVDHLLPGASRGEAVAVFDCRQGEVGDAKALMESQGRLFGLDFRQVVVVKNPPASGKEAKGFPGAFLTDPPPGTVVIVTSSRELPAGSALLKQLPEQGAVLRIPKMDSEQETGAFLDFLARRNPRSQVKADGRVLQEVLVRVGTEEPRQLVREMEKLSLYVGAEKAATLDDVREVVTPSAPATAFALLAQIAEGKASQALATLALLLEQRTPHPLIIGAIGQELRRLLQARAVLDSGEISAAVVRGRFDEFRRALNEEKRSAITQRFPPERRDNLFLQHPYVIYRCLQQALSLDRDALANALEAVVEADFRLKTSALPESQILEGLVLHLCTGMVPPPTGVM